MDPTTMTTQQVMLYAALINAGIGLALGLVPLIMGFVKGNIKYGILGMLGSIIGGAVLGIFLSVPIAAVSTWLIIRGSEQPAKNV